MKLLEIRDITVYNPAEMSDAQLGDDWRITSGYYATWKEMGNEFKYSKRQIIDTTIKILKEILKRGKVKFHPEDWEETSRELYLQAFKQVKKEGVVVPDYINEILEGRAEFVPAEWDAETLEKLDDAGLLERLTLIHEIFQERGANPQDEEVINAYILVTDILDDRGLDYTEIPELQSLVDKLFEAEGNFDNYVLNTKKKIDEIGNIVLIPHYISWTGSTLYAKDRLPNDLDLVVRDKELSPDASLKINRLVHKLTGETPCIHCTPEGPNWRHFPLYHLALVPVQNNEFIEIGDEEKGFADFLYEQRAADPEVIKQAEDSEKEDKVEMGRFFVGMKPTRAAKPNHRMTQDYFISLFTDEDLKEGVLSSKKYDGMRCIIFREEDKIEVWSEDGENITDRLPSITQALSRIDGDNYIIDAELEMWKDNKHQPRESVAGYVHQKGEPDDSNLVLNIFTVLYHNGKDLHKEPEIKRQEILKGFGIPQSTWSIPDVKLHLNLVPNLLSKSASDLLKHTQFVSSQVGSEGVVAKKSNSVYYLDGNSKDGWIKFHNNALLYGTVIKRNPTKVETVFNYDYGILPGTLSVREEDLIEVEGKKYVQVGRTFNTDEKKKQGDLIAVEFETFNFVDNKKTGSIEVSAWAPRYIYLDSTEESVPKEADTIDVVIEKAKRNRVLQKKTITPEGETIYEGIHPVWQDIEDCTSWDEFSKIKEVLNSRFTEIPDDLMSELHSERENPSLEFKENEVTEEKKPLNDYPQDYAILVNHFRGKSVHLDFRRKQDGYLEGETIMNAPEGLVTEDVDTIEKGKKWNADLLAKGKFRPDMDPNQKVVLVGKATQPLVWMNVREVSYPPGSVGATKYEKGVFITMDEGMAYPGTQRPYFKEFFLDMKHFKKQRMVERLLGVSPEWEEQPKGPVQWQTWITDDEVPYILSARQRKEKRDYIPKDEEKAIPPWWEEKIKPEFKWWQKNLTKSEKMKRLDLAFNDLIEQGILKHTPIKIEEDIISEKKGKFTLRFHWWMGAKVVRGVPATDSRYELLIDTGKKYLDRWDFSGKFYGDPLKQEQTPTTKKTINIQTPNGEPFQKWMTWSGSVPAKDSKLIKVTVKAKESDYYIVDDEGGSPIQTKSTFAEFKPGQEVWIDQWRNIYTGPLGGMPYGNPNSDLPVYIDIKDAGEVELIEDTDLFTSFKFDGKLLKGYWIMKREDPKSSIWIFSKGKLPGEPIESLYTSSTTNLVIESDNVTVTCDGQVFELNSSDFPVQVKMGSKEYRLIKTKNNKLLLN